MALRLVYGGGGGDDDGDCNYCRLLGVLAGGQLIPIIPIRMPQKGNFCNSTNYPVVGRAKRFTCPVAFKTV